MVITTIIAIYGACLSTFVLIYSFWTNRDHGEVKFENGVMLDAQNQPIETICLIIQNHEGKDIAISTYKILFPNGKFFFQVPVNTLNKPNIPSVLSPRRKLSIIFDKSNIVNCLKQQGYNGEVNVKGRFISDVDKEYDSKNFKISI